MELEPRRAAHWLIALALIAACSEERRPTTAGGGGGGGSRRDASTATTAMDGGAMDGGAMDSGLADAGGGGLVPVPPMTVANEWPDVEPNDTPEQAVPVGRMEFALWMGFSQPLNGIGSDTDTDFYVFRTGDANASRDALMQICWSGAVNLLDMYLYAVTDGMKGALIKDAESTDTSCETLLSGNEGSQLLAADSVYLLEVRAAPGLSLGGNAGLYGA